VNLLPGKPMM